MQLISKINDSATYDYPLEKYATFGRKCSRKLLIFYIHFSASTIPNVTQVLSSIETACIMLIVYSEAD